ncbi:MAG: hypothetical protein RLY20_2859 [Verrucomicrobiota bacterium]|jgi:hypothetical protein
MTPNESPLTPEEKQSALFAQMVMHVAGTAMVMLGRMPNPMTKKTEIDLESAQLLIDQLEMLEIKTKGNLTGEEQHLLKQNLMMLRMGFVQAAETANKAPATTGTETPAKS